MDLNNLRSIFVVHGRYLQTILREFGGDWSVSSGSILQRSFLAARALFP